MQETASQYTLLRFISLWYLHGQPYDLYIINQDKWQTLSTRPLMIKLFTLNVSFMLKMWPIMDQIQLISVHQEDKISLLLGWLLPREK